MKVLDGEAMCLPYEDHTFDVVLSGHVVGDFYDEEIAEMMRITKTADGWSFAMGVMNGSAAPRTRKWYPVVLNGSAMKAR